MGSEKGTDIASKDPLVIPFLENVPWMMLKVNEDDNFEEVVDGIVVELSVDARVV